MYTIAGITCQDFKDDNIRVVGGNKSTYNYLEVVRVTCVEGYELIGGSSFQCSDNGFIPTEPVCRGKTHVQNHAK